MDIMSYTTFLALHSYVTLDRFRNPPAWNEVILYVWFFVFAAEQFARRVCHSVI